MKTRVIHTIDDCQQVPSYDTTMIEFKENCLCLRECFSGILRICLEILEGFSIKSRGAYCKNITVSKFGISLVRPELK